MTLSRLYEEEEEEKTMRRKRREGKERPKKRWIIHCEKSRLVSNSNKACESHYLDQDAIVEGCEPQFVETDFVASFQGLMIIDLLG